MSLTISLQFPAGRYVAASWGNRDEVEWPPHPARLCLGLIDAMHKSGNEPAMRAALRWLCSLPPPVIMVPDVSQSDMQVLDGIYVPQNPSAADDVKHTRKPRSFPVVFLNPDSPMVFFHWPDVAVPPASGAALADLLSKLPRFGHSSSLVLASLCNHPPEGQHDLRVFQPVKTDEVSEYSLRVNWDGLLESAEAAYDADGRSKELATLVARAGQQAKPDKQLKPAASPRGRHDPRHHWHGYVENPSHPIAGTPWDKRIFILKQAGGDKLGLPSTWQLTEIFHKALLDRWSRAYPGTSLPTWLSGHTAGSPGERTGPTKDCHLAIFPLAYVGAQHATGHIMGLGLGLPNSSQLEVSTAEFSIQWSQALAAMFKENGVLELSPPDRAWTIQLAPEESPQPRKALLPSRWTDPNTTWTSVTPIILDRHPKPHFDKDPEAWADSCAAIIRQACGRLGLPEPTRVNVSQHSPIPGVPPSFGFVAPAGTSGRPPRFHVHASIQFETPIVGPLLIGAGRYRGYGLFLPLTPMILNAIQ